MDSDGKEATQRNEVETLVISEMKVENLEEILAIEREVSPVPWKESMFRRELLLPLARRLTARFGGEKIAGYIIYWLVADEIHLHNIAVGKDRQRKGVASALLTAMISRARQEGARSATLEVRASNWPARRLYERFGFKVTGVLPAYYDDVKEDALIMEADLEKRNGSI